MLEMFVLNPGKKKAGGKKLLKGFRKKSKRPLRSKVYKITSRRKQMAAKAKAKAKVKAGARKRGGGGWRGDRYGHMWAKRIGDAYSRFRRRASKDGRPRLTTGYPSKSSVANYLRSFGVSGLARYRFGYPGWRKGHKVSKRRKSFNRMITFRPRSGIFKHKAIAANRRRNLPRNRRGQFVSRRRARRYRDNWFVLNRSGRKSRRGRGSRRRYRDNWFVLNRRRNSRRLARRRYRDNSPGGILGDMVEHVKGIFSADFLLHTALPVAGGFFASRVVTGAVAQIAGIKQMDGVLKLITNLLGAGLAGWAVGFLTKEPVLAMNVTLGGVANVAIDAIRNASKGVKFIEESAILKEAFGLSGFGLGTDEDVRKAVEAEVMRELGVGDFLTAEQLGRAERVSGLGTFLTSENLALAERIGQYPRETQGIAQYPAETSGVAELSDVSDLSVIG